MNIIDLLIIIIFVIYIYVDYQRGFFRLTADLLGLGIALLVALKFYQPLANYLVDAWHAPVLYAKPLGFLAIWFLAQIVFFGFSKIISYFTPAVVKQSAVNLYFGILPAALKAVFFIAVSIVLVVVMPLDQKTKNLFTSSLLGGQIIKSTVLLESRMEAIFGDSNGNLTFLTNQGAQDEKTPLNFTTTQMEADEEAEKILLQKINEERAKVGVKPLEADILVRNVARIHSRDMLMRGYFSHFSTEGKSLADRLLDANATFKTAGENLALAPNANLAHLGLMGSEKHKANILDPGFTRVGIGVMNAGQYGIMVTQDFIN